MQFGILLAAGTSRRMGDVNKLLLESESVPMIRRCALALLDGGITDLVVVTGHQAAEIETALAGLAIRFVHNPYFASGQASSVSCGIAASNQKNQPQNQPQNLPEAALIALGDMPHIAPRLIKGLIKNHLALPDSHSRITFPMYNGQRGNPVIWGQSFFDDLMGLVGDAGGREILAANVSAINIVEWQDDSILRDIDIPDDAL